MPHTAGRKPLLTFARDGWSMPGLRPLSLLLCLTACGQPSAHFADLPATRVEVDGSVFDVRVRGELAEALRRNVEYAPRLGPIRQRAALAMRQVSGCRVEYVLGDAAVTLGLMECDGKDRDWSRYLINRGYECVEVRGLADSSPGGPYYDYECSPY